MQGGLGRHVVGRGDRQRHLGEALGEVGLRHHDHLRLGRRLDQELRSVGGRSAGDQRTEAIDQPLLDRFGVDVADDDHGGVVGPVPLVVERPERFGVHRRDRRIVADRIVSFVGRPGQEEFLETVEDSAVGTRLRTAPFVEDHTALGLDLCLLDGGCREPLLEDVEPGLDDVVVGGRHREFVDGLVVAGVRVDVGTERGTEAPQHVDQFVLRELLGAVEQHVLEEVRTSHLRVVLERRSGVDDQPHVDTPAGVVVVADQVAQAVVQLADDDRRIGFGDRRQPVRVGCHDRRRPVECGLRQRAARRGRCNRTGVRLDFGDVRTR